MKNLIAQMDAIETGKKYIAESAEPVVEYKGGTDAEKIKNWQKHIDQFKEKGMYKAADDAEKAAKKAQPGFKPARSTDKSTKEGMGSIARALMQDMGMDDQDVEEAGEQPPADWNTERDGVWMGQNPAMAPAVDSSGQPVQAGSGGNVQSLAGDQAAAPEEPAAQGDAPIRTGVEIPASTIINNPGFYPQTGAGEFGTDPQTSFSMPDDSEMGGGPAAPAAPAEPELPTIPPEKLKRFEELLARLEQAGKAPAVKPNKGTATKPAKTVGPQPIVPSASMGAQSPAYDAQDKSNIGAAPAAESRSYDDDTLALIKGVKI
jgi:hypothetical protein